MEHKDQSVESNQAPAGEGAGNADSVVVQLDKPITRGKTIIGSVTVRRPNAGALRGLSLMEVATMNVTALQKLLPRITEPTLTETEVALHLDIADLTAMGVEVAGFLVKKQDKQDFQ